ncbi:hypothetical protein SSYRP_v1c09890 [Spiroplasma syrphidicola EA-1]|uniref:Uncharacterized protein n=1 Tax=Spiroplasma syrphidicola EA-1 TaxID=1276229 RepID=R4UMV7_9MOLU|nr:hypothetical protein [Spiroplasma syrphidicola]AGM26576.1 hypothetical protein SSYRP_v1c09890 [Spiroplasma syrphidicola EA-1]
MKNKMQIFYNSMCHICQNKFKKVVNYLKKNKINDLKNLDLLICEIDQNRTREEDNGIIPFALIFCKNSSYVFLWKKDLYHPDGTTKIKIVNDKIILSQATIDLIKQKRIKNNYLPITNKTNGEEVYNLAKRHFNQQITVLNRHHLIQMSKLRQIILIFGLVFLLFFAVVGGTLAWYFSTNHNPNYFKEPNNNRVSLSSDLVNVDLGTIKDNSPATILDTLQIKNTTLKVTEIEVVKDSNIETKAHIKVKETSEYYIVNNASIEVRYYVFNPNIGTVNSKVNEKFAKPITAFLELDNGIILAGSDNQIYQLNNDGKIKTAVAQDKFENFTKVSSIIQLKNKTILATIDSKIYRLNELGVITEEVPQPVGRMFESTIEKMVELSNGEFLAITKNGVYSLDSNAMIKNKVQQPNGKHFDSLLYTLLLTNTGDIFVISFKGTIYYLNSDGVIQDEKGQPNGEKFDGGVQSIVQLADNTILVGTSNKFVYQLNSDGTIKAKVKQSNEKPLSGNIRAFIQLNSNKNILAGTSDNVIYELNSK